MHMLLLFVQVPEAGIRTKIYFFIMEERERSYQSTFCVAHVTGRVRRLHARDNLDAEMSRAGMVR
jgi:hypothetical protein